MQNFHIFFPLLLPRHFYFFPHFGWENLHRKEVSIHLQKIRSEKYFLIRQDAKLPFGRFFVKYNGL